MTGAFDRYCQRSLMFRAVSCDPPRKDLAPLRYISLELICVLVADLVIFLTAEYADFSPPAAASLLIWRI